MEPGPQLSPGDQALVDLAASNRRIEAAATRRERSKTVAIIASMSANVALVAGVLILIFSVNHRANDAVHSADATLGIARGFQCQATPTARGCPPPRPGAGSGAAATSAAVDSIVYRVEVFVAAAAHVPPPPRPADVPASAGP